MEDNQLAGDREIRDAATVGAVDPPGTPMASRTLCRRRCPPQFNMERVVDAQDALDARPSQVGYGNWDVQGEASDQAGRADHTRTSTG